MTHPGRAWDGVASCALTAGSRCSEGRWAAGCFAGTQALGGAVAGRWGPPWGLPMLTAGVGEGQVSSRDRGERSMVYPGAR